MFLLDTNVVSELRKAGSGKAHPQVVAWAERTRTDRMFVSVVTLQEIEIGILQMERRDPAQAAVLRDWFDRQVLPAFEGRILPIDAAIALRSARLHVPSPHPVRDGFIAATALVHGLTVVTRNIVDFANTGVALIDPWQTT